MNNDRRTFLDGSTAPRKPVTEGAMKAAMHDWLEALPKPAVKEFFGVQKKFPNPKDKKTVDAKNLEILKKYKIKPLINDPSHGFSLDALSCCLDMLGESVEVDGESIYELIANAKNLLVELQTPERRDELDRLYYKAEDKFMRNIGSDALMNALNAIEDKLHKEALSKSTYGKGGKIVKRAK